MNNNTTLTRSLKIQMRVIGALLMREVLTRYGRHNIGFLWLFVEPMMFTVGVTALWSFLKVSHGANLPITAWALTGYSAVLLWRNMPSRCNLAIVPNLALMYHRHVKVIDIYAARILLEIAGATSSFIVLWLIFTALGMIKPPEDILKVMFGWFMLAWFGAAFAVSLGALGERSDIIEKMWHPISYIIFPISGAMFMVNWLPTDAQNVVLLLPMVHGVEIMREGYFGSFVHAHYDMAYMASANLCFTLLGLSQVRVISRTVMPE